MLHELFSPQKTTIESLTALVVIVLSVFASSPCYKPIFVAQGCPKTYFVLTLNSNHMFSKLLYISPLTSSSLNFV